MGGGFWPNLIRCKRCTLGRKHCLESDVTGWINQSEPKTANSHEPLKQNSSPAPGKTITGSPEHGMPDRISA